MQEIGVIDQWLLQAVAKRLVVGVLLETNRTSKRVFGGELWLELEQGSVQCRRRQPGSTRGVVGDWWGLFGSLGPVVSLECARKLHDIGFRRNK